LPITNQSSCDKLTLAEFTKVGGESVGEKDKAGMQLVGETQFFIKTPVSATFEVGKQFAANIKDRKATLSRFPPCDNKLFSTSKMAENGVFMKIWCCTILSNFTKCTYTYL